MKVLIKMIINSRNKRNKKQRVINVMFVEKVKVNFYFVLHVNLHIIVQVNIKRKIGKLIKRSVHLFQRKRKNLLFNVCPILKF